MSNKSISNSRDSLPNMKESSMKTEHTIALLSTILLLLPCSHGATKVFRPIRGASASCDVTNSHTGSEQSSINLKCYQEGEAVLGGCFSALDTVQVQFRKDPVAMEDLVVGSYILVDKTTNLYEAVYSFGQYHETWGGEFLKFHTDDSALKPLEVAKNHMIFLVNDPQDQNCRRAVRADQVRPGDFIATTDQEVTSRQVTKISTVQREGGLYMPLTRSGKLVVNGVETSAYMSIQEQAPSILLPTKGLLSLFSEHDLFHIWLSPYRMFCMGISSHFCLHPKSHGKNEGVLAWILAGEQLAEYAARQDVWIQILIGIPVLLLMCLVYTYEVVMGPILGPFTAIMTIFFYIRSKVDVADSADENENKSCIQKKSG
jgi:hypothetical protein